MSDRRIRKAFFAFGMFRPDAPEFGSGALEQATNVLPVFGSHRPVLELKQVSRTSGSNEAFVTGTFMHLSSEAQALDVLQPSSTEEVYEEIDFVKSNEIKEWHQLIDGYTPDVGEFIRYRAKLPSGGTEGVDSRFIKGLFSESNRAWDPTGNITHRWAYRIRSVGTGTYYIWLTYGYYRKSTGVYTTVGSDAVTGSLPGDDLWVYAEDVHAIAPDYNVVVGTPSDYRLFWKLEHDIPVQPDIYYTTRGDLTSGGDISNSGGFTKEATGAFPLKNYLWDSIQQFDDSNTDQQVYVQSPPISSPNWYSFAVWLDTAVDPNITQGLRLRIKWAWTGPTSTPQDRCRLLYALIEDRPGEANFIVQDNLDDGDPNVDDLTQVGGIIAGVSDGTITVDEIIIDEHRLANIRNWSRLLLQLAFVEIGGATVVSQEYRPANDAVVNGWEKVPSYAIQHRDLLVDDNDATYITSDNTPPLGPSNLDRIMFTLPEITLMPQPASAAPGYVPVKISLRYRFPDAPPFGPNPVHVNALTFELVDVRTGASERLAMSMDLVERDTWAWIEWEFNEFSYEYWADRWPYTRAGWRTEGGIEGKNLDVSEFKLEFFGVGGGSGTQGRIYGASLIQTETAIPIEVSWVQAQADTAEEAQPFDLLKGYVGTQRVNGDSRIYELLSPDWEWVDVSDGQTGVPPWNGPPDDYTIDGTEKSWVFCHWGDKVIATNYVDPVQVKNIGSPRFRPLIGYDDGGSAITNYSTDGGEKPQARFCATIAGFLCLANINPEVPTTNNGRAYSFWVSSFGDPTRFHYGKYSWQSSIFQLAGTPGEITGLTGGEYGLVFKENSVWRADYVGLPTMFNFTQVSGRHGTPFPRSIVQVGDDTYFWGIGGIYKIISGRNVVEIGGGQVAKFLFDSKFEQWALRSHADGAEPKDSSRVIGVYDNSSKLILWCYQVRESPESDQNQSFRDYRSDMIVAYSPSEDRFTVIPGDELRNEEDYLELSESSGGISGFILELAGGGFLKLAETYGTDEIPGFTQDLLNGQVNDFPNAWDAHNNIHRIMGAMSIGNRLQGETALLRSTFFVNRGPRSADQADDSYNEIVQFTGDETYPFFYRTNIITSAEFRGAEIGDEIEIQEVRPIYAVEKGHEMPDFWIWIMVGQRPWLDDEDTDTELEVVRTSGIYASPVEEDRLVGGMNPDGWIPMGKAMQGEFIRFAIYADKAETAKMKEFHGLQVRYRVAGTY